MRSDNEAGRKEFAVKTAKENSAHKERVTTISTSGRPIPNIEHSIKAEGADISKSDTPFFRDM